MYICVHTYICTYMYIYMCMYMNMLTFSLNANTLLFSTNWVLSHREHIKGMVGATCTPLEIIYAYVYICIYV